MIVKVATTECEFRNTHPGIKKMFAWIDETLKESQSEFGHLVVDGVEVSEAPLEYVKSHLKDICEITVVPLEKKKTAQKPAVYTVPSALSGTIQVIISNINFDVEKSVAGVDGMFSRIDAAMKEFGVYFSHLIVDGVEVTDVLHDYVEQNIKSIGKIEVIFITQDQYLEQVMGIMDSFLESALPAVQAVADEFYGKPDDETWARFDVCLNGVSSLLGVINSLVATPELTGKTEVFALLGETVGLHLENLQTATRLNDYTLMADILNFELVQFLQKLHEAVTNLVRSNDNATH